MAHRRAATAAPVRTIPSPPRHADLTIVTGPDEQAASIPNVDALIKLNGTVTAIAQAMMTLTYQRLEGATLTQTSSLLAQARHQLAVIDQLSSGDRRVRASLDGARAALVTAARELRDHLIRHGWVVDDLAQLDAPASSTPRRR